MELPGHRMSSVRQTARYQGRLLVLVHISFSVEWSMPYYEYHHDDLYYSSLP